MVYSATSAPAALARTDPMSYLKKQGGYALFGVVLMIARVAFRLPPAAAVRARARSDRPRRLPRGARDRRARSTARAAGSSSARRRSSRPSSRSSRWPSGLRRTSAGDRRRARCASCGGRSGCCSALFCLLILAEPDLGTAIALVVVLLAVLVVSGTPGVDARSGERHRRRARTARDLVRAATGARASSASSTRGRTRRAPGSRPCRR